MLAFIDTAVIAYTRYDAPQRPAYTEIMSWVADGRLLATTSVTSQHLQAALETESPGLGTADRLHAAVAIDARCEVIVTTDWAFDGLDGLRRIDPLDTAAIAALVAG